MALASDMFQRKMDKLFRGLPYVFGIADGILIAGFDELGRECDETVDRVLEICRKTNLKLISGTPIHSVRNSFHQTVQAQMVEN